MDQVRRVYHEVGSHTDIGRHHRKNQDAGVARSWTTPEGRSLSLAVVADGVSAGRHSEEASRAAAEIVQQAVAVAAGRPGLDLEQCAEVLWDAAQEANRSVAGRPEDGREQGDSTTLVAGVVLDEQGTGVWCGDSRAYLVHGEEIEALTTDHSWMESAVRSGLMSREEAARDRRAHMITRWIGPPSGRDAGVEAFDFEAPPGSLFLACSDGLYQYFLPPQWAEEEMAIILRDRGDLRSGLRALVSTALDRGGYDNITAAAIAVRSDLPSHESALTWRRLIGKR